VATIDFDETIDAVALSQVLAANGVLDTDSYRKLGRNQLRLGVFPSVELSDVEALTATIDWLVEQRQEAIAP
jgi:phosphoserine aminotransferase